MGSGVTPRNILKQAVGVVEKLPGGVEVLSLVPLSWRHGRISYDSFATTFIRSDTGDLVEMDGELLRSFRVGEHAEQLDTVLRIRHGWLLPA